MSKILALALGLGLLAGTQSFAAAPITVTDPGGVNQQTVNSDHTANTRILATPQAVISARQTLTTSAVQLPSGVYTNGLVLRAPTTNAGAMCIGTSTLTSSNGYCLNPGDAISYAVANSNQLWVLGAAGDVVMWTGN